jgi:hypothetical protein
MPTPWIAGLRTGGEDSFGARRSRRWTVVRGGRSVVDLCPDRRFGWSAPAHHWWVAGLSGGVFDVPPQSSGARSAIVWVKVQ